MKGELVATDLRDRENDSRVPVVIGAVAIVTMILGLLLVTKMTIGSDPVIDLRTEAKSGDLSVWVDRYEWLEHNHASHDHSDDEAEVDPEQQAIDEVTAEAQVFAMPASMMPGTPDEGFQRLQIEMNVVNRGDVNIDVHPDHFVLEDADGESWLSLRGGTFTPTVLAPNHAIATVVAFDVPEEESASTMYLVWSNGDDESRFALKGSGHDHG